jgi:hypothetical protein
VARGPRTRHDRCHRSARARPDTPADAAAGGRGGACARGTQSPAATIHVRSVSTETPIPCVAVSFSSASVGPKSAYWRRTSSTTCARTASGILRLLGRPRWRETRPGAPRCRRVRLSRSTCRRLRPSRSAASRWVRRRSATRPRTSSRSSSRVLIVRVSVPSMPASAADRAPGTRHFYFGETRHLNFGPTRGVGDISPYQTYRLACLNPTPLRGPTVPSRRA